MVFNISPHTLVVYGHIIISCSLHVHHLGHYNLVSLLFGITIPTSFNILMKCFYTLLYGLVRWVSFFSSVPYARILYMLLYLHCVDTAGGDLLELLDQAVA